MWMAITTVAGAFLAGFVANRVLSSKSVRASSLAVKASENVADASSRTCKCEKICATAASADVENGILQDIELRCLSYEYSAIKRHNRILCIQNKICRAKVKVITWSTVLGGIAAYGLSVLYSLAKDHLERGEGLCSEY